MALAEVAGRKVYYETHGEPSPVPLVLVSGMAGSCRGWLALQVPELSKDRQTVIFEHRGVGESEDPGGPFTTADLADDTAGLLDALDIERADLMGVFMGGMAAQEVALRHPDRVDRLVLVGSYARPDAKRRFLLEKWREMARAGTPDAVFVRERLLWTLQDETLEQSDIIQAMVEFFDRGAAPVSAELLVRQCDACLGHDTADRLRHIRHRTLVVSGRQDQLTPPRMQRVLADGIHHARLVTFSYGAHLILLEAAERLNQVVLQFLREDR
ncbi:MAG: alpha/beta fold hydrolase [Myxococcota bacterium]